MLSKVGERMEKIYHPYPITRLFEIMKLYTVHYLELNKDFHEEPEAHDFWELVYADTGRIYLESDDETIYLSEDDIYIHKPNQRHRFHGDGINDSRIFIISFSCDSPEMLFFINKLFRADEYEQRLIAMVISVAKETFEKIENNPQMDRLVRLKDAFAGGEQLIADTAELLLLNIYSQKSSKLIRPFLSKELFEDALILSVIEVLEAHLFDDIKMKDIALETNYSISFISTYFKERTHYTVSEYHNILKIERAKVMLKETGHNIEQISRELNFCNQHYFSAIFKRYVKMTPSEYKRSVLSLGKKQ